MTFMNYVHEKPICNSNASKILNYCKDVKCVFEIGAYDGVDIGEIKQMFGTDCHIHAFEPDFESFPILEKYYKSDTVFCNNIALSNFIGETQFVKCYDPKISESEINQDRRDLWYKTIQSLYYNNVELLNESGLSPGIEIIHTEYTVPVTTIDEYCKINNLKPDVLLMDTQGSEYDILEGAKTVLSNVQAISTEWSAIELYKGQKLLSDIENILGEYGFKLVEKTDLWCLPTSNYQPIHGDAVFARI